eukprot:1146660-Pelagomonas_calceolata.AAC.10
MVEDVKVWIQQWSFHWLPAACNKRTKSQYSDPEGYQAQTESVDGIFSFGKNDDESKIIAFT